MTSVPLASLHLVAYLAWEREGLESFESSRAALLDTLAALMQRLERLGNAQALHHIVLGGQTVILEDVGAVRPDLLALMAIHSARGRLWLGPWYVQVDQALVSGEALIRNLLAAKADARQHGLTLLNVAYLSGAAHTAQLPQLLQGFGIDAALMRYSAPVAHLPFRWQAPDGSSVLALNHDYPHGQNTLDAQKALEPDGPLLWMQAVDDTVPAADVPVNDSTLSAYVQALRQSLPDALRPALHGELRLQTQRPHAFLHAGTLSTRLYLKQANARLQYWLTYAVEPLLTIAGTHGQIAHPDNTRALLHHAWRTLLRNQARHRLGGISADTVHESNEIRFREAQDSSAYALKQALRALPGTPLGTLPATGRTDETYLVIWNTHGRALKQVVEAKITLPPGRFPAQLMGSDEQEIGFGWQDETQTLSFVADAPPVGYSTYRLRLTDKNTPEHARVLRVGGAFISRGRAEKLTLEGEQLHWQRGQLALRDVLRFFDGGDAGDTYNYSPPQPDVIVPALLSEDAQVESSPAYQRLLLRYRMRIAPALRPNRGRDRGLKTLDIVATATFYEGLPGVYFSAAFANTAADHRLRAHLRTGLNSANVLADSAFALAKRPITLKGEAFPTEKGVEGISTTYPLHTAAAVEHEGRAMALLARGLPEFEALREDKQVTLALTLLRAVGWLSRDDLRTRTAGVTEALAVPGAQCLRALHAEFALVPLAGRDSAGLLHLGHSYNAPLQVYQYSAPPTLKRHSYLTLETTVNGAAAQDVLLTALKPPEIAAGKSWIVRLLNSSERLAETTLSAAGKLTSVQRVNLAEEPQGAVQADSSGQYRVQIEPHKIVTLRLGFE